MSHSVVRAAFETALAAAFPTLTVVPIEFERFVPPKADGKNTQFAGLQYLGTESPLSIGRSQKREDGTINVILFTPFGRGDPTALADQIRDWFANKDLPVVAPGVRLALLDANPLAQYAGGWGIPTGAYSVNSVAIGYQFDREL